MRSAVALMLVSSLIAGCFPHNSRNRTIAEIVEGGLAVSGVVVEAFVQSGADCDMTSAPGAPPVQCKQDASVGGGIGVALILAGVLGFVATISTAEDDNDTPKPIEIKAKPEPATIAVPTTNPEPPAPTPATTPPPPAPVPAPPAPVSN